MQWNPFLTFGIITRTGNTYQARSCSLLVAHIYVVPIDRGENLGHDSYWSATNCRHICPNVLGYSDPTELVSLGLYHPSSILSHLSGQASYRRYWGKIKTLERVRHGSAKLTPNLFGPVVLVRDALEQTVLQISHHDFNDQV